MPHTATIGVFFRRTRLPENIKAGIRSRSKIYSIDNIIPKVRLPMVLGDEDMVDAFYEVLKPQAKPLDS